LGAWLTKHRSPVLRPRRTGRQLVEVLADAFVDDTADSVRGEEQPGGRRVAGPRVTSRKWKDHAALPQGPPL